ncbi:Uma2 family endonuclease [Streptomyces turgidiscabies]|uniref:Uma2 family endonuclease n=1 Tax=Streptomyces turgidiscabies TaxID=85558 RepID=A0ABU0RTL3_9ACTN|nr:Uma2 family endonuclease [Streptomyces turgidiscabies]MDQ0934472.1 Uma2 family endonuclease [Streptomyces turgidiscabies]
MIFGTRRPQMSQEDFEELADKAPANVQLEFIDGRLYVKGDHIEVDDFEELARRAPEGVKLELIDGKLEVKPLPDQRHGAVVMWLLVESLQQRPECRLYPEQGLKVGTYRKGHAKADAALAPLDHFVDQEGEWANSDGVLMVVEVTSHDRDTDRRDRVDKVRGYAEAGIPVYLLIDRDNDTLVVYSEPKDGTYQQNPSYPYGALVELPAPVNITLSTEKLKDYAD